jgi:hypothetical protein
MGFETFTRAQRVAYCGTRLDGEDKRITITRQRRLCLSPGLYEALGCPARVLLRFDRTEGAVGVSPTTADDPNGLASRPTATSRSVSISCRAFLRHYELEELALRGSTRWEARELAPGVWGFRLDQPFALVRQGQR